MSSIPLQKKLSWQRALRDVITDWSELLALLELDRACTPHLMTHSAFPLRVPRSFVSRMEKGNPQDPLLLQILPLGTEEISLPGYSLDPLQEKSVNPIPGLLHKYKGRVLITLAGACAIHCRYCFRRHFPYGQNNPGQAGWDKIFSYIRKDNSIQEVILSGGDPLMVSDSILQKFIYQLKTIPQIKRLRFHTRIPIVLPERITDELIHFLMQLDFKVIIVLHANHPNEINVAVRKSLQQLYQAGILLLNQTVLLKKINDNVNTLAALSEALFMANVQPYYLHLLDKVKGAAHFDIPKPVAKIIYKDLCSQLPGYLVPKLVFEEPGKTAKTLLSL